MDRIIIDTVHIETNSINVEYVVDGAITQYFYDQRIFSTEYSFHLGNVPKSIAVIPFVVNVLPIVWLTNTRLEINELDEDFYFSIQDFKRGYSEMFPMLKFEGSVIVNNTVKNSNSGTGHTGIFFSGGVDAFSTLVSHIQEQPFLFTLWGADVAYNNVDGWNKVKLHIAESAKLLNLKSVFVRTTFRCFLREDKLGILVEKGKDSWWHGFQHGIGLIGHAAPFVYVFGIQNLYIASTYTIKEKGKVTCASDPTIDNYVRFCGCKVTHDQYEYTRQDKIRNICNYSKGTGKKILLRVCYNSSDGSNCCQCEKCYRTIFGLLAEKCDPNDYGFNCSKSHLKRIICDIKKKIIISRFCIPLWKDIQNRFIDDAEYWKNNEFVSEMLSLDFDNINNVFYKRLVLKIRLLKLIVKRMIGWEKIRRKCHS